MAYKQLVFMTTCATILLLNTSIVSATSRETVPEQNLEDHTRSYFGYRPQPKDSYKKLAEDWYEFSNAYNAQWKLLMEKIEALSKKLSYQKYKENGDYGSYKELQQMQRLLNQATFHAMHNKPPVV